MQKNMWLEFPCSISDIVEKNRSFDACTIWVMYHGKNRNRTSISKEAVEKAIPTLYNCPVVCNYNVEEDTIGGHDVEFVKTKNGIKMVNLTDAIGVIPSGAEYRWQTRMDNGEEHEYLVVDGLLWKRSSAYDKLKRDGVEGQSMEITINSGKSVDGIYEIYDFDFTAFCILGEDVAPCFEGASIETFSLGVYKTRFASLMEDLKKDPSVVTTALADDNTFSLKGGEGKVNLNELMAKYGLTDTDISFETEGLSTEELEAKFAEIQQAKFAGEEAGTETPTAGTETGGTAESGNQGAGTSGDNQGATSTTGAESGTGSTPAAGTGTGTGSSAAAGDGEGEAALGGGEGSTEVDPNSEEESDASGDNAKKNNNFALMAGQLREELFTALGVETYFDAYWEEDIPRYWLIDFDADAQIVYADDWKDCVLCGFNYTMNGDHPVIDFASYKRKKVAFVDFDEGEPAGAMFSIANDGMKAVFEKKFAKATKEFNELKKFHDETVAAQRKAEIDEVFASFGDLAGNESFEALKANYGELTVDEVSEKCFAIRGRSMKVTFSANQQASPSVKLPVERRIKSEEVEPYNGIFAKYGFKK